MKRLSILTFTLLFSQILFAQSSTESLEKHLTSVDVGFLGAWINHERQIGEQFTLNANLGFDGGLYGGGGEFNYLFVPSISVEPRFYYNFNKRVSKGKRTMNNSANYLTIATTFFPKLIEITNDRNNGREIITRATFIPEWGIRRSIGNRFKFDFAVGYGLAIEEDGVAGQPALSLSFGYVIVK
ncbi:hypothetical protein WJR50_26525 [Catalinimonas sp. 4WD22]|uniref:hypothetical protein n=1 Tax=Catalinimonas locisalis TaxID=3133978 RepID=UPI003100D212